MFCEVLLVTVVLAADADRVVKEITQKEPEFDSFAEALRIIQKSGTVVLSDDAPTANIEIEVYRHGKKLPTKLKAIGARDDLSENDRNRIRYAVNFIDTDFLTLADSNRGHCRVQVKLRIASVTSTDTFDFPKKECDFSKMTNGGGFGPKASTKDRIPLFWMIDGRTASLNGGGTPEDVVKNNPQGDMAIVYIRLTD